MRYNKGKIFASIKVQSLPGTLMGVTQLSITKVTGDGYQKLYSVFPFGMTNYSYFLFLIFDVRI